ncbi:MAG TPA: hypothetical protein VGN32_05765 [Ktedonobacterales bacterium]|nr:hypothetical protein [Ktedonobacterales bacterium]
MEPSDATAPDEAQRLLDIARSPAHPQEWFVWPLRRDVVKRAALGWALTAAFGFLVFVPAFQATVPSNFVRGGAGLMVFTIILLLILGIVAFGGLGLLLADLLRLARADQYLLVMTPSDYIKATPRRITRVPMASVAYVTLKGVKLPPAPGSVRPGPIVPTMVNRFGAGLGAPGTSRREFRRPPSLAFQDKRTKRAVMVATDDSFDQLAVLEEILSLYAGAAAAASRGRSRSGAR